MKCLCKVNVTLPSTKCDGIWGGGGEKESSEFHKQACFLLRNLFKCYLIQVLKLLLFE